MTGTVLPAKPAFARMGCVYLNSGSTHPLPLGAQASLRSYIHYKTGDFTAADLNMREKEKKVRGMFAALVGASPDEVCIVQSTTAGENLVLRALDLPRAGTRVVTDVLHYSGSAYTYANLAGAGVDVITLPMTADGRIDMAQMEAAVDERTALIAISLVSHINGFEHDLKRVCDLAHAHGAHVYADIIQAAGTIPVDLRASGVDFAASASYKWLMGDFGLGFLYVRREIQGSVRRPWWGYDQVEALEQPVAINRPGEAIVYTPDASATGLFAMGTLCRTGVALLDYSLDLLLRLRVEAIQAHRQPLIDAVQSELRRRGYRPLTPDGLRTPLVSFALEDAQAKLNALLEKHKVRIGVAPDRFRISIAAFNDMNDIDHLLWSLPKTPPR